MTQIPTSVNYTPCQIRQVDFLLAAASCDRCGCEAERVDVARRTAIDIDLDQPVVLAVRVSVHYCPPCHHYFRAQPPFLRREAIYTPRVVRKAIEAVYADGLAFRLVGPRLARDFWVQPSQTIIRRWCRAYHESIALDGTYQEWIVAEFSGVLCVDEVYQHELALLMAVDPAAPDGDRLVGYQLVHGTVDAAAVERFLARLAAAGIVPDEVITDGSTLYPRVLAAVWPQAAHQLCLFHETRRLTAAAQEAIRQVRRAPPTPPPAPPTHYGWGGPLRADPPGADRDDPAVQRWHTRQAARRQAIAQVQALARQGLSQRAIARRVGLTRRTVHRWLQEPAMVVPALARTESLDGHGLHRPRQPTAALLTQLQDLARQGVSHRALARAAGVHRATLAKWLRRAAEAQSTPASAPVPGADEGDQRGHGAGEGISAATDQLGLAPPPPPPAPWTSWEEVHQVRELLQAHRGVLLRRPEHLSAPQQEHLHALLTSPVGPELTLSRQFLLDWYAMWHDADGAKRSRDEAHRRYTAWREDVRYAAVPALRRALTQMTETRFATLSPFLRQPHWEATNNGAERAGRAFRHGQAPHFNLRSVASIDGALKVRMQRHLAMATAPPPAPVAQSTRGRRPVQPAAARAAA